MSQGPKVALKVVVVPNVGKDSTGGRLTGFCLDDEVAIMELNMDEGLDPLSWRSSSSSSQRSWKGTSCVGSVPTRPPPFWLGDIDIPTRPRRHWYGKVLACDPNNPERFLEHQCLIQGLRNVEQQDRSVFEQEMKDSLTACSYAHRYNLHMLKDVEEQTRSEKQLGKSNLALQVSVPVLCEVLGSSMPQFLSIHNFVLVSIFPKEEVHKFVYDGVEGFVDTPQAFFHYAMATSNGREMLWDLQGVREKKGTVLLVNPVVFRKPNVDMTDVFNVVKDATAGQKHQTGLRGPRPQQFDNLHPHCTATCETFDQDRRAAHGRGNLGGFSCRC